MKAAVFHAPHQPLTIEEVEIEKPKRREILLRTAYAGLCHSDLHFMEGLYPYPAPAVLGHEGAAVVEAVGEDVTYVKPGDHVITCLSVFCGECDYCTTGHTNLCDNTEVKLLPGAARRLKWKGQTLNQAFNLSVFAENMLVHEHAVVKIGKDIPLDRAALVGCGVMTGVGAVFNAAKVEPGSTVAVVGCGGIGLSAVNGAALAGASKIIAIDTNPSKLEKAPRDGRDRYHQRLQRRSGRGGQGHDQRPGRALFVRGDRPENDRGTMFRHAAAGRRRDHHRHDPVRHQDRAARRRLPARPENPGHQHGRQPVPRRHAAVAGAVAAGTPEAGHADLRQDQTRCRSTKASRC